MPKNFSHLFATALFACVLDVGAQETPPVDATATAAPKIEERKTQPQVTPKPVRKPVRSPSAAATIAPVPEVTATPKPKKPNFFQRLFNFRKAKATPAPTATPSPSPTPRKSLRKPGATPAPAAAGSTKPATGSKPTADGNRVEKTCDNTPAGPADHGPTDGEKPVKTTKPESAAAVKQTAEPPADADADTKEKFRFENAKAKAMEDPQVKSLKAKADDASTDEDSRQALRAYNKALFEKIPKTDSGVSERATRMEAAILKRLSE